MCADSKRGSEAFMSRRARDSILSSSKIIVGVRDPGSVTVEHPVANMKQMKRAAVLKVFFTVKMRSVSIRGAAGSVVWTPTQRQTGITESPHRGERDNGPRCGRGGSACADRPSRRRRQNHCGSAYGLR